MKKILIVSLGMEIGGAERSLITMLSELDYSRIQVDLFLLHKSGDLLKYVPKEVNILKEIKKYSQLAIPFKQVLINKYFDIAYGRLKAKIYANGYNIIHFPRRESYVELEYSHKYTKKYMPLISKEKYDVVISYLTPHYFALEKTIGRIKIAWIHTDYKYINCDLKSEEKMWNKFDYIVAISEAVKESFIDKFPSLKKKVVIIENTISRKFIMQQADVIDVSNEMDNRKIKLLSIGRFCYAKNFDNIPEICSFLLKRGHKIKWYIIGFGLYESYIRSKIAEYGMEDTVIILGKKKNPYPYIKACDIYIQPSRYEGKAITVLEAQALNKPVIITNYGTAGSQLKDGVNGIIVNLENKQCADQIGNLINDEMLKNKLVDGCKKMKFPNDYDKLYNLSEDEL